MEKDTGARGLRSIIEEVMLDIMFDLPDQPAGSQVAIDEAVVMGQTPMFALAEAKTKIAERDRHARPP